MTRTDSTPPPAAQPGSLDDPLPMREAPAVSLFVILREVRRHAGLLALSSVLGAAATLGGTLALGVDYVAEARFVPQSSAGGANRLAGLAAQFGVAVPSLGGASGEGPPFYASVLRSRTLLRELVLTRFAEAPNGQSLLELYLRAPAPSPSVEQENKAIERAGKKLSVDVEAKTGIVTLRTAATSDELAVAMNRRLLALLADFNLTRRQTQAKAERIFVEQRRTEARSDLANAEGRLTAFLARNRSYQGSPQLVLEYQRLAREADMQRQIYSTISQSYEQARIEEVRNTPVFTMLDQPSLTRRRLPQVLATRAAAGLFAGPLLAAMLLLLGAVWRREVATDPMAKAQE